MIRTRHDHARHDTAPLSHNGTEKPPEPCPVAIRSFKPEDYAAVKRLYHEGLINEQVTKQDPVGSPELLVDRYMMRPQDHLWVGEFEGNVVASVGITEEETGIGHVRRLRVDKQWLQWEDGRLVRLLITLVASHARQHDQLKLVIHTALHDERAIAFMHQLGFEFARVRDREGRHLLEFYLNIYDVPERRQRT